MIVFAFAAAMMAVILLVAGWERPRLAVIVAAILWPLYAYYEYLVATGVLCDADCNIRADLALFFPILGVATYLAYWSYNRPPGQWTFAGLALCAVALVICALLAWAFGHTAWARAAGAVALAVGVYAIRSRSMTDRS